MPEGFDDDRGCVILMNTGGLCLDRLHEGAFCLPETEIVPYPLTQSKVQVEKVFKGHLRDFAQVLVLEHEQNYPDGLVNVCGQ